MSAASQPSKHGALATSLILLLFVLLYAATGYLTLDPASRAVPLLAALVTGLLIGVELVKRRTASSAQGEPADAAKPGLGHELLVLASVAGAVTGVYLVGFLIALPLYLLLAIALIGRQPWRVAIVTSALTSAAIYVAFELVLSYRLFAGIVFS